MLSQKEFTTAWRFWLIWMALMCAGIFLCAKQLTDAYNRQSQEQNKTQTIANDTVDKAVKETLVEGIRTEAQNPPIDDIYAILRRPLVDLIYEHALRHSKAAGCLGAKKNITMKTGISKLRHPQRRKRQAEEKTALEPISRLNITKDAMRLKGLKLLKIIGGAINEQLHFGEREQPKIRPGDESAKQSRSPVQILTPRGIFIGPLNEFKQLVAQRRCPLHGLLTFKEQSAGPCKCCGK
ncbi:uncharacterized protein LOC115629604 [Scaptodrosophila lebanonensis]|uniref:Uncharacterized protein LOC115629604 n=1 Tax=Drosophila lebanonensis TaxID=7225 RepID=A0A6J2U243_DROLE|nr:uncharacterized protein LOC115629604 [Scaptodrosophila lebanonensis]